MPLLAVVFIYEKIVFKNLPPVTKNLLIINLIIFAAMFLVPQIDANISRYCALRYVESPGFGFWQLLTYMFVHGNFTHLFFNMFALVMFGGIIEWTLGSKRFLVYYISCGIGAALLQFGVYALMLAKYHSIYSAAEYSSIINMGWNALLEGKVFVDASYAELSALVNTPTVGASGAIYGVLLAFGMLYPNRELYLMFIPVPVKAKWMVLGYAALELLLGVSGAGDHVAHFCHLGGMLFGFGLLLYWKKKGTFNGWY